MNLLGSGCTGLIGAYQMKDNLIGSSPSRTKPLIGKRTVRASKGNKVILAILFHENYLVQLTPYSMPIIKMIRSISKAKSRLLVNFFIP